MPRILISVLLAAILPPIAAGQMSSGNFAAWGRGPLAIPSGQAFPHADASLGARAFRHSRNSGFGYPLFYADYGTESAEFAPAPPIIVEKRVFQPEPKPEPVLIEWHSDRFVRYGGAAAGASPDYAERASRTPAVKSGTTSGISHELPPAVLVYRDGHREEVRDYVITRGVLYARIDYTRDGSWMRNIQLSALDLSATMRANESGVRFILPSGPNEVVTRP